MKHQYIKWLLFACVVPAFSETIEFWKLPEKPPIFHQESKADSKAVSTLKPHQIMILVEQQKEWVKFIDKQTGHMGWIAKKDGITPVGTVEFNVTEKPNVRQYSVKMHGPKEGARNYWSTSRASFYEGNPGKNDKQDVNFTQLEKAFWEDIRKEHQRMEKIFENAWTFKHQKDEVCKTCQNKTVASTKKVS